jgi:hypothetical protein
MDSSLVDPRSEPQWDEWIRSHREASFFHSRAWARTLAGTYGHEPAYVRLADERGTVALIPLMEVRSRLTGVRGVCLPFTDLCEPLAFEPVPAQMLMDAVGAVARDRKWKHFEVRGPLAPERQTVPSVEYLGHTLDLSRGTESIFERLASPVRRAIRKAEKSGLTVAVSRSREEVAKFYRLHERTRRRHGVPPQPRAFFRNIHREILEPGFGFVAMASQAGRPVAGAMFFKFGKKAVYKFGASTEAGREMRANNLVMWEGIKALVDSGCDTLHFGRTSLANDGLRRFKLGWGAAEDRIGYYRFDARTGGVLDVRDKAAGLHTVLFRTLPLAANRFVGAVLYPHLD